MAEYGWNHHLEVSELQSHRVVSSKNRGRTHVHSPAWTVSSSDGLGTLLSITGAAQRISTTPPLEHSSLIVRNRRSLGGGNTQLLSTVTLFPFSSFSLSVFTALKSLHVLHPCLREEEGEATALTFCSTATGEELTQLRSSRSRRARSERNQIARLGKSTCGPWSLAYIRCF